MAELVAVTGNQVNHTNRSGTITLGGTAQNALGANAGRRGFWIQNQSTGDFWINSTATATGASPDLWLPAGSYYESPETGVATTAISIYGTTTGQAFAAREW